MFWIILVLFILLLLIIMIITTVHEFGHYSIAKYNKVRVIELSIGFGPKMFQFRRNDTVYTLRWLPFGGYVSVLSDELVFEIQKIRDNIPNLNPQQIQYLQKKVYPIDLRNENFNNQKSLDKVKSPNKALFAAGGVLFNFIFVFGLLFFSYMIIGRPERQDDIYLGFYYTNVNDQTDYGEIIIDGIYTDSSMEVLIADSVEGMIDFVQSYGESAVTYTVSTADLETIGFYFYSDSSATLNSQIDGLVEFTPFYVDYYVLDENGNQVHHNNPGNIEQYNAVMNIHVYDSISSYEYEDFWIKKISSAIDVNSSPVYCNSDILYFRIVMDGVGLLYFSNIKNSKSNDFSEYVIYIPQDVIHSLWYAFIDSFKYLTLSFLWILNIISFNNLFDAMNFTPMAAAHSGAYWFIIWFVQITLLFSLLIIIFNLLPIPPLDGWKIFEYNYEGIRKKKISAAATKRALWIGWSIVLIYFFVFIFFI